VKVSLLDFKVNELYDAADRCGDCGGKVVYRITWVDPDCGYVGEIEWECLECGAWDTDIVGWRQADEPVEFMGRKFYPLTHRANVGPCLNCGRLVVGVPLILFLDKGEKGELDFCWRCVRREGWDEKLLGSRIRE